MHRQSNGQEPLKAAIARLKYQNLDPLTHVSVYADGHMVRLADGRLKDLALDSKLSFALGSLTSTPRPPSLIMEEQLVRKLTWAGGCPFPSHQKSSTPWTSSHPQRNERRSSSSPPP